MEKWLGYIIAALLLSFLGFVAVTVFSSAIRDQEQYKRWQYLHQLELEENNRIIAANDKAALYKELFDQLKQVQIEEREWKEANK